jgi:dipeptidyl aminopeptidase/acylaminoacyl peptidase
MTTPDTFGRDLSRWLHEDAEHRVPEHLGEVLMRTAATRQRPWWSSPERWLPVETTLRLTPAPRGAWLLLVLALVVAVVAAIVLAGAQRRLPEPFGLARDGTFLVSEDGDIYSVDPGSGERHVLIGGPTFDFGPFFARDGTKLLFLRGAPSDCGKPDCGLMLTVANADGTAIRELTPGVPLLDWVDWSPDGSQIAFLGERPYGDGHAINVVNVDGTGLRTLDVHRPAHLVTWLPGPEPEILFRGDQASDADPAPGIFAVHPDGSGLRELSPSRPRYSNDYGGLAVSMDGNLIAYNNNDAGGHFQVSILDQRTHGERVLPGPPGTAQFGAVFSPDATSVAYIRWWLDGRVRLVVAPVDGSSLGVELGPTIPDGNEAINNAGFAPDGKAVYANYDNDKTARLLPVDGSPPTELGHGDLALIGIQRLAP